MKHLLDRLTPLKLRGRHGLASLSGKPAPLSVTVADRAPKGKRVTWLGDLQHVGLVLLLVASCCLTALMTRDVFRIHLGDWGRVYYSARLFLEHKSMYGASPVPFPGNTGTILNLNPPHVMLIALPAAPFPEWLAGAFGLVLASAGAFVTLKIAGRRRRAPLVLLFASAPTQVALSTGQYLPFLLGWAAACAWLAAERGRWSTAARWLGLVASVKVFALIFVPYLVIRRRYRPLAWFGATFVGAFAVGAAVFGPGAVIQWMTSLKGVTWYAHDLNGSVLGFLARSFDPRSTYASTLNSQPVALHWGVFPMPGIVRPIYLLASAAIGLTTLLVVRTRAPREAFVALWFAALLVCPLGWPYYLWLAVAPALAPGSRLFARWPGRIGAALLFWPVWFLDMGQPNPIATATIGSVLFWGTLLLWVASILPPAPSPCLSGRRMRLGGCPPTPGLG
jgi:hypothetical protein